MIKQDLNYKYKKQLMVHAVFKKFLHNDQLKQYLHEKLTEPAICLNTNDWMQVSLPYIFPYWKLWSYCAIGLHFYAMAWWASDGDFSFGPTAIYVLQHQNYTNSRKNTLSCLSFSCHWSRSMYSPVTLLRYIINQHQIINQVRKRKS